MVIVAQLRNKKKIDKLNFIKTKNFYLANYTIKNAKRPHTQWEKIFASYRCDKELLSGVYKESLLLLSSH